MLGKKRVFAFVLLSLAAFSFLGASVMGDPMPTEALNPKVDVNIEAAEQESFELLILGKDRAAELCDVLMLVSYKPSERSLCVVQIPRDTYFAYTDGSYRKINAAARVLGGADKLSAGLSEALGVSIDGYVEFDLDFVKRAVDMVGGVEVAVPCDMDYDDEYQDLSIHLKKGVQKLTGTQAVAFIRFRSGYLRADLGRMDAQKLFLASFAKAFSREVSVSELPRMLLMTVGHFKTDVRFDTLLSVLTDMRRISADSITVFTLPGEEYRSEVSGAWYYILSHDGCETAITHYLAGDGYPGFDRKGLFTDKKRTAIEEIYHRNIPPIPYTFTAIMENGVEVE